MDSDTVLITLRIENDVLEDVKIQVHGVRRVHRLFVGSDRNGAGQARREAYEISKQAVADALGGIPEYKMQCSNLAPEAIRKAIDDWRLARRGESEKTP